MQDHILFIQMLTEKISTEECVKCFFLFSSFWKFVILVLFTGLKMSRDVILFVFSIVIVSYNDNISPYSVPMLKNVDQNNSEYRHLFYAVVLKWFYFHITSQLERHGMKPRHQKVSGNLFLQLKSKQHLCPWLFKSLIVEGPGNFSSVWYYLFMRNVSRFLDGDQQQQNWY